MAKINSLQDLFLLQLRDLYDAEKRLTKAIPKIAKATTDDELRAALENHLTETEEQVSRLEQIFDELGEPARGTTCAGIRGIIEEGDEHIGGDYGDDSLRDAAIIGAAQRAEHYEMGAYGTAIAHAKLLGLGQAVNLLEETLVEEKAADKKLTEIADDIVNPQALKGEGGDFEQEDDMVVAASPSATGSKNRGKKR